MIVVNEAAHSGPRLEIPLLDLSQTDLLETVKSLKRIACPEITDESPSEFSMQLVNLFSTLAYWTKLHLDRAKMNAFLSSATSRESVRGLCQMLNYTLFEGTAASTAVTFTCQATHPQFTIPKNTQVSTADTNEGSPIIFETAADTTVDANVTSVNITCRHGITVGNEIIGTSDSTSGQRFKLRQPGVVWQSESIEVRRTDGVWEGWTRVESFLDSTPTDKHYRLDVDDAGYIWIVFSDGLLGAIPIHGANNVRATYRRGGGVTGNVGSGQLNRLVASVPYVTAVSNSLAATGGQERESIEHAKMYANVVARTQQRWVTERDIEELAELYVSPTYGRVAKAKVFVIAGFSFSLAIVPTSGGMPAAEHRAELQAYLAERRLTGTAVEVIDPIYHAVTVEADLYVKNNFAPNEVAARVRDRLVMYLSPAFQDPITGIYPHGFGRNIWLSDIWSIIDGTDGIDHAQVISPSADVLINDFEISDVGVLAFTVYGNAQPFTFYSGRDDIISIFRRRLGQGIA